MTMAPQLFTFDVFGTLIDWRTGLLDDLSAIGVKADGLLFDQIIDAQAELQRGSFLSYREITKRSLIDALKLSEEQAESIAGRVGHWPFFPDSKDALRKLMATAPCVAMTNSDRVHGEQAQAQLGFRLSGWLCAEELQVYKPDPQFWQAAAHRFRVAPGASWWHVSAYADFDLDAADKMGLTTVFIDRPHSRPGSAKQTFADLAGLAAQDR